MLFQGLRLGWILAPVEPLRRRILTIKQAADLQTGYLVQGIILEFMQRGYFEKFLKRRLIDLRASRDAMRQALKDYLPETAQWRNVGGGICFWVRLPPPLLAEEVLLEARQRGVVFAPESLFAVGPSPNTGMRLGFSNLSPDQIRSGVRVIGQVIRKLQGRVNPMLRVDATQYARAQV